MPAFYFICVLIAAAGLVAVDGWTHDDQSHWPELCHSGTQQSPIALYASIADPAEFPPLGFYEYGHSMDILVKNNGHSAEVRQKNRNSIPEVSGGGLPEVYQLDHLHFHWQSEHTMEDYRFPLELHLVHYAKRYGSLQEGLKHPGGVTVFAVLFDLSPDDVEDFDPLLAKIAILKNKLNVPDEIDGFVIKNYLPRDTAGYYRYDGSLTTPNCTEGVIWTVFTNTIPISRSQVEIFERIHADNNRVLKQTYRSIQNLNDRRLMHKISPLRSNANIITFSLYTFVITYLLRYLNNLNYH